MIRSHDGAAKTIKHNATVARRAIEEIWNGGNLGVADELFTATYVNYGGLIPDAVNGPEAIKLAVALHRTAFPDLHVTVQQVIAEGEIVAIRWVARSTGAGASIDSDPAATTGTLPGMTFCRLIEGKILESWTCWDAGGVLRKVIQEVGLSPAASSVTPSSLN